MTRDGSFADQEHHGQLCAERPKGEPVNRRNVLPVSIAAAVLATVSAGTAVAGHAAFSDAAGTHEPGIHWLAETGVTAGCGDGKFCTEDAVKRGQMATFLHRFSGNGDIPPVVNADKVDGLDAEQLRGATGAAGPQGEPGEPGPAGPPGPAATGPSLYQDGARLGLLTAAFTPRFTTEPFEKEFWYLAESGEIVNAAVYDIFSTAVYTTADCTGTFYAADVAKDLLLKEFQVPHVPEGWYRASQPNVQEALSFRTRGNAGCQQYAQPTEMSMATITRIPYPVFTIR
jgi:hypothetical protein